MNYASGSDRRVMCRVYRENRADKACRVKE
jgi:hypothetical protein